MQRIMCYSVGKNVSWYNILKKNSVMLEFSSCKRGNDIKNTSTELEELRILIADTENVKKDISTQRKY